MRRSGALPKRNAPYGMAQLHGTAVLRRQDTRLGIAALAKVAIIRCGCVIASPSGCTSASDAVKARSRRHFVIAGASPPFEGPLT
jgi:hypothetical protein